MNCPRANFAELSKEILGKGNCLRFQACGGSMHPFIKNGQIIQVRPTKISEINSGDIIFYRNLDDRMIVHRVIKKYRKNGKIVLLTKGDSTSEFDEYVYPENILGKVVAIEKNNKAIRIDKGLLKWVNTFLAKFSPFSKWIYFLPLRIKHRINRIKNRYASRRPVSPFTCKAKH
jgi:hypothetical protein